MRRAVVRPVEAVVLMAGATLAWARGAAGDDDPTFTRDVAPILYAQCATCHRPGGPAPFSLLTYKDAKSNAALIAAATAARRMPPWLPEPGPPNFAGERRLTDEQIATLQRWAAAGAPEGNRSRLPPVPKARDGWQLGQPDLIVEFPAYAVPDTGTDVYRNLVAAVPLADVRYVNAVEVRPGDAHVVHHARLMVDPTASSREWDAKDAEPGFDGMDVVSGAANPDGFFVGWTPGKVPSRGPDDMAWALRPGTDLVLQVHLRPRGARAIVRPQVGLFFARQPPTRRPALLMFNFKAIDIPPGKADYEITDSYTLPTDVEALGVYPHAHYLAREMQGFARLPDGQVRWLLHIKEWDFNWQDEYRYREPIPLPKGSIVVMRYLYDNSASNPRNPNAPPRRVTYGPRSTDEMGDLLIQVVPRSPAELALLNQDLAWKYQTQDAQWRADRELLAGNTLAVENDPDGAFRHLRAAIANRIDAAVHASLAATLAARGEYGDALLHGRAALQLDPRHPLALAVMARLLVQHPDSAVRNVAEAERLVREALLAASDDAFELDAIATAFAALGDRTQAVRAGERAVAVARDAGRTDLAAALEQRLERYRAAMPGRPPSDNPR